MMGEVEDNVDMEDPRFGTKQDIYNRLENAQHIEF
jgi:hypothetical protein